MENEHFEGGAGLIQDITATPNQRQNPLGDWDFYGLFVVSMFTTGQSWAFSSTKGFSERFKANVHSSKKHKNKSRVYLQNHFFSISLFVSNPDQPHTSFRVLGALRGEDELEIQERACSANGPWLSTKMKTSLSSFNVTSDKLPFQTHRGEWNQQVEGRKSSYSPNFYKSACN